MSVKRGDIYYADLSPVVGSEQGGLRPVLIIQNDVGNRYSPTVIAAAITSRLSKTRLPTHIDVYADRVGLVKDSVILLEQVRTLDKRRLKEKMGHLDEAMMAKVNQAIAVSVGLGDWQPEHRSAAAITTPTSIPSPTELPSPAPTVTPMPHVSEPIVAGAVAQADTEVISAGTVAPSDGVAVSTASVTPPTAGMNAAGPMLNGSTAGAFSDGIDPISPS